MSSAEPTREAFASGCPLLKNYVHLFADLRTRHFKLDQVCPFCVHTL
jgi:hypothetical protein